MNNDDVFRIMEVHKEIADSLCTTIKVHHDQVFYIVVNDLVNKYRYCNDITMKDQFHKVIRFYITEEELQEMLKSKFYN